MNRASLAFGEIMSVAAWPAVFGWNKH
jgi:hypothetical protein